MLIVFTTLLLYIGFGLVPVPVPVLIPIHTVPGTSI